ncbi:RNA-directed DNA polymerase [Aeromonas caviae]|uniref:RNA-directed DNA polymerase n=1 Tax=Aeromonas caviae TaxID=648 RepID=UPI0038D1DCFD
MPKIIIRTDISSFYESISHDLLKLTLERHGHLSLSTKRIINETLKFYTIETGSSRGLPRGIGISAYLSEVFMIDIDDEILKLPHIIYYKRYVDDIIAIFSPPIKIDETLLMQDIERIINNHKLTLKEGANKRGNSSRLTQSFHFFMFEPIFSPVNALNQPI